MSDVETTDVTTETQAPKAPMTILREKLETQANEIRAWMYDDTTNGQNRALATAASMLDMAAWLVSCVQAGCLVDVLPWSRLDDRESIAKWLDDVDPIIATEIRAKKDREDWP